MKKFILLLIIPFLSFGQDDYVPQSQRDSEKNKKDIIKSCVEYLEEQDLCNCFINSMFEEMTAKEISKWNEYTQQEMNKLVWDKLFKESLEENSVLGFECSSLLINFFNTSKLNSIIGKGNKDLGNYCIINGKVKAKGINFKIKKPFQYIEQEAQIPSTIIKFVDPNWKIGDELVTFSIHLYDYKTMQMEDAKGISKYELKNLCYNVAEIDYFETAGYFGWTELIKGNDFVSDMKGSVINIILLLDEYIFSISSTNLSQPHTDLQKSVFYKMCHTLQFY